jgi:LmbE family N-acetylglucosaminyl deacetylase
MFSKTAFTFYDLRARMRSVDISLLFPGWEEGAERVAVLSPHDDDAVLGAGYALLAAEAYGAEGYVFILCDGRAGYTSSEEKDGIVVRRREEAYSAYKALGIPRERILRFEYPDFSLLSYLGWQLPRGEAGTFDRHLRALRSLGITRLLLPNGYREHIDHEATYRLGAYDAPQAGDPILPDWGPGRKIWSTTVYAVWGDFSPEDALVTAQDTVIRANRAISATADVERLVVQSIRCFESQGKIIEGLVTRREQRWNRQRDRAIELYLSFDPRPALDYAPYHRVLEAIEAAP